MTIAERSTAPELTHRQRALGHAGRVADDVRDTAFWLAERWPTGQPIPKLTTRGMPLTESAALGLQGYHERVTYQAITCYSADFEECVGALRGDGGKVELFEVEGYRHGRRMFGTVAVDVAGPLAVH